MKPSSALTGILLIEESGGVAHTRTSIGLDFGLRAERGEPIRINDHLLDPHLGRAQPVRELAVSEIKPFIEAVGEVIRVVHHEPDAIVILASEPDDRK